MIFILRTLSEISILRYIKNLLVNLDQTGNEKPLAVILLR